MPHMGYIVRIGIRFFMDENMEKYPLMNIVDLIYGRGIEHKDWHTVLENLCDLIKTKRAWLFLIGFNNETYRVIGEYGFSADISPLYKKKICVYDATATIMKTFSQGSGIGAINYKIIETRSPDLHQNLTLPNNVGFISALNICKNENCFVGIGFHRSLDEPQLNFDALEVLRLLHPHFKRAFSFSDILEKLQEKEGLLSAALAQIPLGLVAVDSELKIHFVNDVAKLIANQKLGIAIENNQLKIENHSDRNKIKSAIVKTLNGEKNACVVRSSKKYDKEAITMTVTNYKNSNVDILSYNTLPSLSLIYLSHSDICSHVSVESLQQTFKLTPSESQLALSLTNGLTLQDYAELKKLSIQTIRSQLKVVFNKIQVKSQTELVRKLLTSSINILL